MNSKKIGLLLILLAISLTAAGLAHAEGLGPKFGPFLYYAPYYFPKSGCCMGICFTPADFVPKYECPIPHAPGPYTGPIPPPPPMKAKAGRAVSRPPHAGDFGPPGVASGPPAMGTPIGGANALGSWIAQGTMPGPQMVATPPAVAPPGLHY